MLVAKKTIEKIQQIENRYFALRYHKVLEADAEMLETRERLTAEPCGTDAHWEPVKPGQKWGGDELTAWFRCDAVLPECCEGLRVFVRAKTDGETLFLADGQYKGVFDVNHPVVLLTGKGVAGSRHHLAFEAYAGHHVPGCGPDEDNQPPANGCKQYDGVELLLEREDVSAFVFGCRVLRQLADSLDQNSLRRYKILKSLERVFEIVDALPGEHEEKSWRAKLGEAAEIMQPLLAEKNSGTAPYFGVIGHSHIDTAWLWPIAETRRKCARTFSSVLNLMEQYPEFVFVQSAPYHADIVRRDYPQIFERIRQQVKKGRWEPNGAMWVEPDCNITSGESLVRQLLVGTQATREMFGYSADTLWLPDVFGYSAALPQILRGCNVEFFCTTKISWNDTTRFPYDTFVWKGIDGTSVIAHFHYLQCEPDPKTLIEQWNDVQHKDIQDRRLIAIGYGDGGGGPTAEMIETARRVSDLEGCPRAQFETVSSFMRGIRDELTDLPEWNGELYLELHRGTLTSQAEIKRGNRKAEIALRNAEFACTLAAIGGAPYPSEKLLEIWKTLLVNQFHDILPGTSIERVNREALAALKGCGEDAGQLADCAMRLLSGSPVDETDILLLNSLNWNRDGEISVDGVAKGLLPAGGKVKGQWVENIEGNARLIVSGVCVPALGGAVLALKERDMVTESAFCVEGDRVETPYATVAFDKIGRIISFVDKASERETVKQGGAFNTFWIGEDVPRYWDNWDIDRDQRLKMRVSEGFIRREIKADGPLQLRLRSFYRIGEASELIQDTVFHADSAQVDFETLVNWHEKHTLLKAGFDLNVFADAARYEIQYGHVQRPTHENLPQDRAKFEVCMHKWVDLSEAGFGVALLNDSKYGVSVKDGDVRLSLIKSGLRPDVRGDEGRHLFTYSLLPHASGFSVPSVVRPAYELNVPLIVSAAGLSTKSMDSIALFDTDNVVVESVKWAENGEGFVLRFYDALKAGRTVHIRFNVPVRTVYETNLLEENDHELMLKDSTVELLVKPFEIKTIFCRV